MTMEPAIIGSNYKMLTKTNDFNMQEPINYTSLIT